MARTLEAAALIATALCFSSLLGVAYGTYFFVEGKVYCDTCRVQFETKLSHYIQGAKVRLECRNRVEGHLTYSIEGQTDKNGVYSLAVEGDHQEDICEVLVLKSPLPDCNQAVVGRNRARVLITADNGILSPARYANPLGFLKEEALPNCAQVLKELGFFPLN